MSELSRPVCGNGCPHFGPVEPEGDGSPEALCLKNPPAALAWWEPGTRTEVAGVALGSHRPGISADTPCCDAHPDWPAYLTAWQAANGIAQPTGDTATYTWHGLNAGPLTIDATSEDDARTKAKDALVFKHLAEPDTYTAADLDFDLMMIAKAKPETED